MTDWRLKRRSDVIVTAPEIRERCGFRSCIGCYDGAVDGYFRRHREANNSRLHQGLKQYTGTQDRLYPDEDVSPRRLEDA